MPDSGATAAGRARPAPPPRQRRFEAQRSGDHIRSRPDAEAKGVGYRPHRRIRPPPEPQVSYAALGIGQKGQGELLLPAVIDRCPFAGRTSRVSRERNGASASVNSILAFAASRAASFSNIALAAGDWSWSTTSVQAFVPGFKSVTVIK